MRKLLVSIAGVLFVIFAGGVAAQDFIIEDNGSGSQNSINFKQNNQTNVQQSNQMDVQNKVDAQANTGGNSVSGGNDGSVTTGNARVNIDIDNNINHNWTDVGCCGAPPAGGPTPTPYDPGKPTPQPSPSASAGAATPTPVPGSGNGGNGGGSGSGGPTGGGQVLGLSATNGEFAWLNLFYLASGASLLVARKLLSAGV